MSTPPSVTVEPEGVATEAISARPAHDPSEPEREERESIPAMQRVLDNPFLLLFIGVTIPTVFYIIWGVMEIVSIPMAR
jgi:hypothetical protein